MSVSCLRLSDDVVVVAFFWGAFFLGFSLPLLCVGVLSAISDVFRVVEYEIIRNEGKRERTGDFVVCSAIFVGVRLLRSSRIFPSLYVAHVCAGRPSCYSINILKAEENGNFVDFCHTFSSLRNKTKL